MAIKTVKASGSEALQNLNQHRADYPATGWYPFLIGDGEELERIEQAVEYIEQDPATIIRSSLEVDIDAWISRRRAEGEEYGLSGDEFVGQWPGEDCQKGSITLHTDILTGKLRPEVFLGMVQIEQPWQLPAVLKYGGWNECPEAEVHCAFHRHWQQRFDAEITGVSSDVIECAVTKPPTNPEAAMALAWEQYWYCSDIVEQGCESVAKLAAILIHSPYWYFWWD